MATVGNLVKRVESILSELKTLETKISESYEKYIGKSGSALEKSLEDDYISKANMYDRLFQEQEAELQASGGKSRAQTLQEYILLLFFVAFAILSITITVFAQTTSGRGWQVFGLMFLIIILSSGFIMRYG